MNKIQKLNLITGQQQSVNLDIHDGLSYCQLCGKHNSLNPCIMFNSTTQQIFGSQGFIETPISPIQIINTKIVKGETPGTGYQTKIEALCSPILANPQKIKTNVRIHPDTYSNSTPSSPDVTSCAKYYYSMRSSNPTKVTAQKLIQSICNLRSFLSQNVSLDNDILINLNMLQCITKLTNFLNIQSGDYKQEGLVTPFQLLEIISHHLSTHFLCEAQPQHVENQVELFQNFLSSTNEFVKAAADFSWQQSQRDFVQHSFQDFYTTFQE